MKISSLAEFVIKISIERKPGTGISSVFVIFVREFKPFVLF
jgi:hypothetical protein